MELMAALLADKMAAKVGGKMVAILIDKMAAMMLNKMAAAVSSGCMGSWQAAGAEEKDQAHQVGSQQSS